MLRQPLRTLSGGQRRRIELARILFSGADTLLLDEPTNHLDADSVSWLRDHLRAFRGGLVVISHDTELLEAVVNKVFHLDADRSVLDIYNLGWKAYLDQRETDARRRRRERLNAERQATALQSQADKMRAKATKAKAAQNMQKRAEKLLAGVSADRAPDKVARLRFPTPAHSGKTPLAARGLSKSYGSLEVFTDVDVAVDRGARVVVLGLNGAGKTTLLRLLARVEDPDTGEVLPGHGLRLGYYAQEHETLDNELTVLDNMRSAAPDMAESEHRSILGSFLFSGDDVSKPTGVLSGGEKTRLALALARGFRRQCAVAGRAHEQPRSGEPGGDPFRAAAVPGRDRPGHPRRGRGRRAPARARRAAARRGGGRVERGSGRSGGARLSGSAVGAPARRPN